MGDRRVQNPQAATLEDALECGDPVKGTPSDTLLPRRLFKRPGPLDHLLVSFSIPFCRLVLSLCVVSLFVSFGVLFCLFGMGQTASTPLSLTLAHWSEVSARASNLAVRVKKGKWQTFCSSQWPTFGVGWPADGTFDLNVVRAVKQKIFVPGSHGHPDQQAYIWVWEDLVLDPPKWVR